MSDDPTQTNPDLYRVLFENDRVRVLDYEDVPGAVTDRHSHPDSVMVTLSSFQRRVTVGDHVREVDLTDGTAVWLPAQTHVGENVGSTSTHVVFVELKDAPTSVVG